MARRVEQVKFEEIRDLLGVTRAEWDTMPYEQAEEWVHISRAARQAWAENTEGGRHDAQSRTRARGHRLRR